jgi:hypothetical protein
MSITVADKITESPAGEFAPMAPAAIREALRGNSDALALWLEAQSKPVGWSLGNRDRMARDLGWTAYRIRRAIRDLRRAGLYLVERIQDAAGRWSTACRFIASLGASPQVTPKAGLPEVGNPAGIPPVRENRERGGPHLPATCRREAAGLACRDCAAYVAEHSPRWPARAAAPTYRPAAEVLAAEGIQRRRVVGSLDRCEHDKRAVACLACASARFGGG